MELKEIYDTWIQSKKSVGTQKKYNYAANLFCDKVFNKKPWEITEQNLNDLKYHDVYGYFIKDLREGGVKDGTIKNYLVAVKSYMSMLEREDVYPNVNFEAIKNKFLDTKNLSLADMGRYECLSEKEIQDLKNFFRTRNYNSDETRGEKYAMLVDFMFKTAIRTTAAFNIKWKDFSEHRSAWDGEKWIKLNVLDKGHKLNQKDIRYDYYLKLKKLLYKGKDNAFVFEDLNKGTFGMYIAEFGEQIHRSVSPHSIKIGAATTLWTKTKDILLVRDFCDHESVTTTERYIRLYGAEAESGTAIMQAEYDFDKLTMLSQRDLLAIVMARPELQSVVYSEALARKLIV